MQQGQMAHLFDVDARSVAIDPGAVTSDVLAFRACTPIGCETRLAALCQIYSGDLLAGVNEGGEALSAWLGAKRAQFQNHFCEAVLSYIEARPGSLSNLALAAARRVVLVNPFEEAGYRALMRGYAERGDIPAAQLVFKRLERLLSKELGCKPSAPTRALYQSFAASPKTAAPGLAPPLLSADATAPSSPPASAGGRPRAPRLSVSSPPACAFGTGDPINRFVNDLVTGLAQTQLVVVSFPDPVFLGADACATDYRVELRLSAAPHSERLRVQLVGNGSGERLWQFDFGVSNRRGGDIRFAVFSITNCIERRELALLDESAASRTPYRMSAQGVRLLREVDLPTIRKARKLFKASLWLDPSYPPALAGLSRSYVLEWLVRAPLEISSLETAERHARTMLSLNANDHRGYQELGVVKTYLKDLDVGLVCLDRAATLSSGDPGVRADFANALVFNGQASEAAKMLTPPHQGDDYSYWVLAGAYFSLSDYRASLRTISLMRKPDLAFRIAAASFALLGDVECARGVFTRSKAFNPDFDLTTWLSLFPCRDCDYLQRYSEGLRKAGF